MKSKAVLFAIALLLSKYSVVAGNVFLIGNASKTEYFPTDFSTVPQGGDTIKIQAERTTRIKFSNLSGSKGNPIVIINTGGKVTLRGSSSYSGFIVNNCSYIKVSGNGDAGTHYGFKSVGSLFGLSFENLCSNCEAQFYEVDSCALGVHAKKDYGGNPPTPCPEFNYLAIHDCYINNCTVGFYIGESKYQGMLFKHLRLYNNVITNTGRESLQIENCVEDVEVYNNFCYNAGRDSIYAQQNNTQLGINGVSKFYNNIFVKAPSFGTIMLGKGDMYLLNNYYEDNQGVFIDDRCNPIPSSPIKIGNNFFRNTKATYVVKSLNFYSDYYVSNNTYNTNSRFLEKGFPPLTECSNNLNGSVDSIKYTLVDGVFHLAADGPQQYLGLGPVAGKTHVFNQTPVLDSIPDIIINVGDTLNIPLTAYVNDNDSLYFFAKNLPSFASISQTSRDYAVLKIDGRNHPKCVYTALMMVADASHGAISRRYVKIALKAIDNHPVTMSLPALVSVEAATKLKLDIPAHDMDRDTIRYTLTGLPKFVKFTSYLDSAIMDIKPSNIDPGEYPVIIKAEDGYSAPVVDTILIRITPSTMSTGRIVYRVNCGGVEQADYPINWQGDKDTSSPQIYVSNNSKTTGSDLWSGTNNTGAPNNLFGSFRYNGVGLQDMKFEYPCENGHYRVNLFFAERYTEVNSGVIETFGVYLEDSLQQDSVNLYKEAGYAAIKKSFDVDVRDNSISLMLHKLINNSKLNGVEIIYLNAINMPPVIAEIPNQTMFEGDTLIVSASVSDDAFGGNDSLSFALVNPPHFASLSKVTNGYKVTVAPDYNSSGTYSIVLKASDGTLCTQKSFTLTVNDFHLNPPVLNSISKSSTTEGRRDTVLISFTDPDNDLMTLSVDNLPVFAQFTDLGNGSGRIILLPGYNDAGSYSMVARARDSFGFLTSADVPLTVLEGNEVVRIPLSSMMITNLVINGSTSNTPVLLVNEQNLDPTLNQNPTGVYWNPATQTSIKPFTFYIDLGHKYVLKKLYMFDVNNVGTMDVYSGEPSGWNPLCSLYTNTYMCWRLMNIDVSTRYLFFSTSSAAYISEIALYGYLDQSAITANGSSARSAKILPFNQEVFTENDAENTQTEVCLDDSHSVLNVTTGESNILVDIYSMSGGHLLHSINKQMDVSGLSNGIYIVTVMNLKGDLLIRKKVIK